MTWQRSILTQHGLDEAWQKFETQFLSGDKPCRRLNFLPVLVDLQKIVGSKRAYRARLAGQPIGEKLRMLDAMREREISLRDSAPHSQSAVVREEPAA